MKNLIEKYFNGETSLQEEAELKAYFQSGEVDEALKDYLPLFQYFANEKGQEVSSGFEERLFEKMEAIDDIAALVEKYFEGTTTLEEEATLRAYFTNNEIAEDLKQYQPLFQYFENEKAQNVSADFDKKLLAKMDSGGAKIIQMRTFQRRLLRVAAVVAVLLGAYVVFQAPNEDDRMATTVKSIDWSAYEIHDEQLAYEETVKALRLLSEKLNKGKKRTAKEVAKAEPVTKYLN